MNIAAIPRQFLSILPTGKPTFVVTEKNSATWQIGEELSQAVVIGLNAYVGIGAVVNYITKFQSSYFNHIVPKNYEDSCLNNQIVGCSVGKNLGGSK